VACEPHRLSYLLKNFSEDQNIQTEFGDKVLARDAALKADAPIIPGNKKQLYVYHLWRVKLLF
jgi:Pyruvate carboxylase